jgi:DNA-binding IclR family transcriptional regulator
VLKALTWIVEERSKDVGVRELATGLKVSPSTAHRLLKDLAHAEFVKQDEQMGRYSLSVEFVRLAHLASAHLSLEQVALMHMRRLSDVCNETSLLGVYDGSRQEMVFMAMVESSHPLRYSIELNRWFPLHLGASGLAILAHLEEGQIASIVERAALEPATSASAVQPSRLGKELQAIRKNGYAVTHGVRTPGVVGLAAPVFGGDGEVIGTICLAIPETRFNKASEPRFANLMIACAREVTKSIGGRSRVIQAA